MELASRGCSTEISEGNNTLFFVEPATSGNSMLAGAVVVGDVATVFSYQ